MVFDKMEKNIEHGCSPVIIQPPTDTAVKKSNKTKHVIIGVTVIAVTLVVVVGFLGGMYLLRDTANTALKTLSNSYSDENGNHVDETYQEYPHDVKQYTIRKGEESFTVVEDFGRRLRVLNTTYKGQRACLLTPLNVTYPESDHSGEGSPKDAGTTYDYVHIDDHQIVDKDILGRHAQNICAGAPLYWALHMETAQDTVGGRQKRRVIYCDRCDCYGCTKISRAAQRKKRDVYHCERCVCSGCR